ncbi:MAG TPA: ornithine cyclodeaminase family protein [Acidobacteriaceae bacterium]|jgi:ornithine cyclodeaminase/alanine dehydrogenase-like protein (mu-crystallin family)|nr:ornithine cyclodeaminase family protein [Acidobacteriaceae bacterium]
MRFIDREEVARRLTYDICIPLVRDAMIAFSAGETKQLLRSIIPLAGGHLFGIMPGALGANAPFGAKLISIFPENAAEGHQSHQGLIVLFEPETGTPVCVVHAGEVTAIRTAAASAVATDALARKDAKHLAILGTGEQAATHARAISKVRALASITIWGRSLERAHAFATRMRAELGIPITAAATVLQTVADADIICTVTSAPEPILKSEWVQPGQHINAVGSSHAGPSEIDNALVARARFFADSREGVLNQGAEFLRAKHAGLIDDHHILAEIGEVLAGTEEGRGSADEITIYKSLGHIVQDLASAWWLYSQSE